MGARAYKGEVISGGRVSDINVDGNVDINKAGVYYITYSSGKGEFLVSVTRTVVVKDDFNYILAGCLLFFAGSFIICLRLFVKRKEGQK